MCFKTRNSGDEPETFALFSQHKHTFCIALSGNDQEGNKDAQKEWGDLICYTKQPLDAEP